MTLRDLLLRVRALAFPRRLERELDEELTFHIERETQKHIAEGLSPSEARTRALARFGSVALAADLTRDARGTVVIDTLARDLLYALRSFRRAPLVALTVVGTVGLGLGLVAAVFTLYSFLFLRVDAVRSPDELFAVTMRGAGGVMQSGGAWMPFTPARYEALRRETSVFTDAAAMMRGIETRIDGRQRGASLVSGNFFQLLGVNATLGRALTPSDDDLSAQPVIVLSHRGWARLSANDPAIVGRRVRINGTPFEIVGVMPDGFRGLGIAPPDCWAPLAHAAQFHRGDDARAGEVTVGDVIGRLKPGVSAQAAAAGLTTWASGRADLVSSNGRFTSAWLRPSNGTMSIYLVEQLMVAAPIFFAFGLILMIGCANVANLLLARGIARQREIGIRLALGASRRRIIRQLLTESLLLALAAAAWGLVVSRLVLEGAAYAAITTLPPGFADALDLVAPVADWRVIVFLVAIAVVSTLFFGLVPALQATRLELVRTVRGDVTSDARPGRARQALIALQTGASALLLIAAAIFLRGALAAATQDPGLRTSDTIVVHVATEARRTPLLQAITGHPSVVAIAAWRRGEAVAETSVSNRLPVDQMAVSPEYLDMLDIHVVRGRGFTQAERSANAGVAIVSETAAHRLWPNTDALGQAIRLAAIQSRAGAPSSPSRTFTVVGVVRDMSGPLVPDFFPSWGVFVPAGADETGTSLLLRVRGNTEQARQALLEPLTQADPALGQVNSLETIAGLQAYLLQIAFWVAVVLGGLALALTVSGLFSVLSYVVEQRAKDIGVRMALGATTRDVVGIVLSQSLRPVGIGLAAGGGLAAAVAILLMATPGAGQIGGIVRVFDPVAYGVSLLVIVAACALAASVPAVRAAHIDPIATLRKD
jgi:predicted permease